MCLPFIHFHHICVHRISGKHLPLTWKDKTKTSDEAGTISFFEGEVGVQGVGVQEGGGYGLCCTQGLGDLGIYIYICVYFVSLALQLHLLAAGENISMFNV